MMRFGGGCLDNPFKELKELDQTSLVEEYIAELELYLSRAGRFLERQFLGYFMGGLRHDICTRIRAIKPCNRYQAMQLARDVESKFVVLTQGQLYGLHLKQSQPQIGLILTYRFRPNETGIPRFPINMVHIGHTTNSGTICFQSGLPYLLSLSFKKISYGTRAEF